MPQHKVYKMIINTNNYTSHSKHYTFRKMEVWEAEEEEIANMYTNHTRLPHWVPDYAIYNQIYITHNAHTTTHRLSTIARHANARHTKKQQTLPHITTTSDCR